MTNSHFEVAPKWAFEYTIGRSSTEVQHRMGDVLMRQRRPLQQLFDLAVHLVVGLQRSPGTWYLEAEYASAVQAMAPHGRRCVDP